MPSSPGVRVWDKLEQLFYKTENGFELLIQIHALFMLKFFSYA
jgi:hypothetical protein